MSVDLDKFARALADVKAAIPGSRIDPSIHDADAETIAALKSLGGFSYVGTSESLPGEEWDVVYFHLGGCHGTAFSKSRPKGSAVVVAEPEPLVHQPAEMTDADVRFSLLELT